MEKWSEKVIKEELITFIEKVFGFCGVFIILSYRGLYYSFPSFCII